MIFGVRTYSRLAGSLLAGLLLALSACQAAPSPGPELSYPAEALVLPTQTEEAYPAGATQPDVEPPVDDPQAGYPAEPLGMPAVENSSRLTARLVSSSPDEALPGFTRLRVLVLSTEMTAGMPSFTQDLVDQEVDLYAAAGDLPALTAGENIAAEVTYRGDEHGGKFFVQNIEKIAP
jgi:hypothetical protein